jgi:hypothetical protein
MSVAAALHGQDRTVPATAIASRCGVVGEANLRSAVKSAAMVRLLSVMREPRRQRVSRGGAMSPRRFTERSQVGRMFARGSCGIPKRRRTPPTDPSYPGGLATSLVVPRGKTMVVRSTRLGLRHKTSQGPHVAGRFPSV